MRHHHIAACRLSHLPTRLGALSLLLLLLGLATGSQAQSGTGVIMGTVKDETGAPLEFAIVVVKQAGVTKGGANADENGEYRIGALSPGFYDVEGRYAGNIAVKNAIAVRAGDTAKVDVVISMGMELKEVVITSGRHNRDVAANSYKVMPARRGTRTLSINDIEGNPPVGNEKGDKNGNPVKLDREGYEYVEENRFLDVGKTPQSTFSIDVDVASYSNCRRMVMHENRIPPAGAIRVEELINYFHYQYPQPTGDVPFSITTELGPCPWEPKHQLVLIGLQGKRIETAQLPTNNLVFLVDVSGSMSSHDKLPLLKSSLGLLVNQLRPRDRVAIVAYAGAAGLVLASTPGSQRPVIKESLERLESGGSTAGGAGIDLAYKVAQENFLKDGNNRVVLCTDGDFNVGASSDDELVRLIEQHRKSGIFLSVLGFGTGNVQDHKMEQLADHGNGNYAYIDQLSEGRKVLVKEMGATLFTIAKDVKLQIEFNPTKVSSYRLIGYENRRMENEDFDNDQKDAGELGAGHSVTALYEIVPAEPSKAKASESHLRYQSASLTDKAASDELMLVKLRYKQPQGTESQLIEQTLPAGLPQAEASNNLRWASAVAAFGMVMRGSEFCGKADYAFVEQLAQGARGEDLDGLRAEFVRIVQTAGALATDK